MVKFKIHYTINDINDYVTLEGEDIADIQKQAKSFKLNHPNAYDFWSEQIN